MIRLLQRKEWYACCSNSHWKVSLQQGRCKSHYETLGVDEKASQGEIKAAYYQLSLLYHPDRNIGSDQSAAKFREITEAYEVLSNPHKKEHYDKRCSPSESFNASHFYKQKHSSAFSKRSGPRTGRTGHYDYDEHYEQHYGQYERMDNAQRARHRTEHMWENFNRYQNRRNRAARDNRIAFSVLWLTATFLIMLSAVLTTPRPVKRIYYRTEKPADN